MKDYIKRNIEEEVIKTSKSFPVILVTGPRQVGKSTLLSFIASKISNNFNYVTLDNYNDRILANEDPELFLETYKTPLIIDEFQYAPKLLSYIKINVDKMRLEEFKSNVNSNAMYFLTGSQSFLTMKNVSESLAGRVGLLNLYGLSTREINKEEFNLFIPDISKLKKLTDKNKKLDNNKLFERIYKGSYPELYKNSNIEISKFYESYVKTYIERDVRDLINVKDEIKFVKFMVSLASRTGRELDLVEISRDAEITSPTAMEWLSILVNTNLVYLLEPYSKNIIKRVVKRPKLYFMDTGLACYLTRYPNSEILESSAYAGQIFETYVITEIIKSYTYNGLNPKDYLYYYRDNNKNEIDLLINYNEVLYPIEIKKSKNPGYECIKNFQVLKDLNIKIGAGIVLCQADKIFPIDKDNFQVPIRYI